MMKLLLYVLVIVALPALVSAQKIGVLPFEDASGVGEQFGENVAKFIRSEFLKDKALTPKFIPFKPKEGESTSIDVDQAIELGKKNGVAYVVIGTILEADASSSSSGIGGISVFGQNVGSNLRTVSAKVTIQGDLISVKDGKLIESFRTTGSKTDASVGADVSTEWGSLNTDKQEGNDSPNAKALREAVEDLVEQMTEKIK
jgi:curli biogenesis system outer membrane secretion channel CsgG